MSGLEFALAAATTAPSGSVIFAEEKPSLQPLPIEPFRYYQYGEHVVHLDGCIEVEAAFYDPGVDCDSDV